MIENYLSQTIWNLFMKNEYVKKGLEILEFRKVQDSEQNKFKERKRCKKENLLIY
mgnify:FL=1